MHFNRSYVDVLVCLVNLFTSLIGPSQLTPWQAALDLAGAIHRCIAPVLREAVTTVERLDRSRGGTRDMARRRLRVVQNAFEQYSALPISAFHFEAESYTGKLDALDRHLQAWADYDASKRQTQRVENPGCTANYDSCDEGKQVGLPRRITDISLPVAPFSLPAIPLETLDAMEAGAAPQPANGGINWDILIRHFGVSSAPGQPTDALPPSPSSSAESVPLLYVPASGPCHSWV